MGSKNSSKFRNALKTLDNTSAQVLFLLVATTSSLLIFRLGSTLLDPDSYYHLGCAELYARQGWLSSFPWLKYTVLGEDFPNVHLLQHLLLAPFSLIFSKTTLLTVAPIITTLLLTTSIFFILKRWHVKNAHLWAFFGLFSSPIMLGYLTIIKGGSTFFILLVFYVDALVRKKHRALLIATWISVYAYVGAPILMMLAFLFSATISISERKLYYQPILYTAFGLLGGLLVNPFFPENIFHIERELMSPFNRPDYLKPGIFMGSEWRALPIKTILHGTGFALALWFISICASLRRGKVQTEVLALFVCCFGLFGASLFVGTKIIFLFLLLSNLGIPLLISRTKLFSSSSLAIILVLGIINATVTARHTYHMDDNANRPSPLEYEKIAGLLSQNSKEGEVIVSFWDDFPGLFYFNKKNTHIVGMNPSFLLDADPTRFKAYYFLFNGKVRDPENLLPQFFEDARIILLRTAPRNNGEKNLIANLAANKNFIELQSPSKYWRAFQLRVTAN